MRELRSVSAVVAEPECRYESKGQARPVHLGLGKGHRFSSLGDDHIDKLLTPLAEKLADPLECRRAGFARNFARFLECRVRAGYRGFDILRVCRANIGEFFTGPGIVDRLGGLRLHPAAVEVEGFHGFLDAFDFPFFDKCWQTLAGEAVHEFLGVESFGHHDPALGDFSGGEESGGDGGRYAGLHMGE